jgi:hypothetical protein
LFQVAVMFGAWVAESRAVLLASITNRCTCLLLLASAVMTVFALAFRSRIVVASPASNASRLSASASAGSARLSADCRSSERNATAAPSSLMIRLNRSRTAGA